MEKKVAIAVDKSVHSMDAVNYAALMASKVSGLRFVLLHVQPPLSQYLKDEAQINPSAFSALKKAIQVNESKARQILESAAQHLMRKGVAESRITQLTIPRNTGLADDILALGQANGYDAILVGRHGASYLRDWVMGSVTANLVENSKVIPIWVVDGETRSDKVLLAADGSSSALRALDHLAFMVSGSMDGKLNVLHVQPRFQDYCEIDPGDESVLSAEAVVMNDDTHCMNDFYQQACTVLEKNSLGREHLELHTLSGGLSVATAILQFARDNNFGTIVMGRRGRSKSLFTGSVSRNLLHKISQSAVWVVP